MAATSGNFRLGPDNGRVVLKTGRQGIAARAGHDLTIEVTRWSAQVEVPDDETGGAKPLSDRDRRDIKKQMSGILGDGAASFTSSRIITSGASGGAIEGSLTLSGKTQPVRLQVTTPGSGRYRGTATVVQSAFGIKPYVGFFGALKLRDEVGVEFDVDLNQAEAAESAG